MDELEEWLAKNYPDLLREAVKEMKARPGWDLADCVDLLDSQLYHCWCERDYYNGL